jgi:outer membrane protein insertion porin family
MRRSCSLRRLVAVMALVGCCTPAFADAFKVSAIEINGLERISRETVLSYLDISPGETFDTDDSSSVIKDLYASNFFKTVSVSRHGDILVVNVVERPTIASVDVSGNETIDKDKFKEVLKTAGLVDGAEFSDVTLDRFKQSLIVQYYQLGHYNARVDTSVTSTTRNRVNLKINISEGRIVKVEQINIIGNKAFKEKELAKQLELSKPGLFSFFTREDQYTREKLDTSIEKLTNFYLDHGYLRVKVDSAHAQLTPDRNYVYLTFKVTEGDQYKISAVKVFGKPLLTDAQLKPLIKIAAGQVYSKEKATETQKGITDALGDRGYAYANVSIVPTIDDATKTVSLAVFIDPGQRVYIRHVKFSGNTQTADVVLRRELRQLEGGLSSTKEIKGSEERIRLLGSYIQEAKSEMKPVEGAPDQADLIYKITEAPPATAIAGISYGTDGFGFNASVNNTNLLGSGKTLSLSLNSTPYVRTYSINYLNPYYTFDGISRGFSFYAQRYDPGKVNIANYSYETLGGSMNYGVPISAKNDDLHFGLGLQNTRVGEGDDPSLQVQQFFNDFNTSPTSTLIFNQALLNLGWSRNNLDRFLFPTKGLNQNATGQLAWPVEGRPLKYYKLGYNAHWYQPIHRDFIFSALAGVNYGGGFGQTDELPFFQNYYSGGIGSVRGYENNTLGPIDSLGNPIGGNFAVNATAEIIFPNFISPNNLRTSLFVDSGNVYNTKIADAIPEGPENGQTNPHAGPIRYSTGLAVEWRAPVIGMFSFSLAKPINPQPGDSKTFFQFNFGTQF